jgi:pimeloyl-ACP methyl ester carboxylesterase
MPHLEARDGTRLFYKDLGKGPTVLLVHAWSLHSGMWEYQVAALRDAGYRCIAIDRRGHGRSDVPTGGFDLDSLADDLAALIDHLVITDLAAVVAHSLGVAETGRLVFSGTITPGMGAVAGGAAAEATIASLRVDRPQWFRDGADAYFALPESGISEAVVDDTFVNILQSPLEVQEACVRTMFALDAAADLRRLSQPVLLLHGDRDASAPLELTAQPTAASLANGELKIYRGAGHGLYLTHKDRYNGDVLAFFAAEQPTRESSAAPARPSAVA